MRFVFVAIASLATATAFAADVPEKVNYEDHVKPIFRQYCFNCHNQGEKKGGLALDTFGSVIEGGGSGEIVFDDGDADGSRLWQLVNHDDTPIMPPNSDKLPEDKLTLIRAWITGGVLENSGSKAKKKTTNALAYVASSGGKPEGPAAMPEGLPLATPVVTDRAAAVSAIAASPWAPLVAVAGQRQIILYHSETSELLGILPFEEGIAQDLRFNNDGSYLIAGGGEHSAIGIVAIYDVKTGERIATIGDELDVVFGADANDNMSRIAFGGPKRMLRIYDATNGEKLFDIKKHTDWIYAVAYSPDGVLLASGDRSGGLCIWEAETGRLYMELTGHKGAVYDLAWRDDSNVLASASEDGTVKLWEMQDGKTLRSINAHGGGVLSVDFDHQANVATAGADNRVKVWDANGKELKSFAKGSEDMLEVALSHDGKRVIYGNWSGEVYNSLIENPDATVALAANPAPAAERAEAIKTQLVSVQQKLAPAKASLDQATNAVTAAKKPLAELDQQIAALRSEAEKSEAAAKQAEATVAQLDKELPAASDATRDLQDVVTALRVQLKSDLSLLSQVAEAEEKLAGQLAAIAKQRRSRIATAASIGTHRQNATAKAAEADKLAATRPELQKKIDQAQQLADAAKKAHDEIAAVAAQYQSKIDRLLTDVK